MNNITVPNGTENKIRSKAQAWLIISQLIAGFFFICWGALALAAAIIGWPMVIETEGGWDFLAITFSLMLCYPLYAIIPPIVAWIF